jgi:hypothetical protein
LIPQTDEGEFVRFLQEALDDFDQYSKSFYLGLVLDSLRGARPFQTDSLIDLKIAVRKCAGEVRGKLVLSELGKQISFKSPVLGGGARILMKTCWRG